MKPPLFFIFLFLCFFQIESRACSCSFDKYLTIEDYNNAAVIFTGEVVRVDTIKAFEKYYKVFFLLDSLYKGTSKTDTIVVYTHMSSGMCGVRFRLHEKRLIFTSYKNNYIHGKSIDERILFTKLCYRNCRIAEDRSETGEMIWKQNLHFLKQISEHKNFLYDQYYVSNTSYLHNPSPDTLYAKGLIQNGFAVGDWYYYDSDKLLKKQITYAADGSIKEIIQYYPNGNIQYKLSFTIYQQESYVDYDESGTLVKQENTTEHSTGIRAKVYYKPSGEQAVITYSF